MTSTLVGPAAAGSLSAAISGAPTSRFAPGATVMMFSPDSSTVIMAIPVGAPGTVRTARSSIPSLASVALSVRPKSSSPTQPTIRTRIPESAPSLAAATAWLAPFPPGAMAAAPPRTVAPGPGSAGTVTEMSIFRLPSTVSRASRSTTAPYSGQRPALRPPAAFIFALQRVPHHGHIGRDHGRPVSKDVDHGRPLNPAGLMWCVVSVRAVRGLTRGARARGRAPARGAASRGCARRDRCGISVIMDLAAAPRGQPGRNGQAGP